MSLQRHQDELLNLGFTVVPGLIDLGRCAALRETLDREFQEDDTAEGLAMVPSRMLRLPLVRDVPFRPEVVEVLGGLLGGQYIVYPNFTTRRNLYVPWHVDVAFRGDNGGHSERPSFLQCAVYLQPNDKVVGGGIDVVPGSHKRVKVNDTYYAPASALEVFARRQLVASAPGDLVIFDGRLLHASSGTEPRTAPVRKYGIFWTVSRADARSKEVLAHLKMRTSVLKDTGQEVPDARFADMRNLVFPDCYPDSAVSAEQAGLIRCATLETV
jgi:hypothetical protein